MRKVTEDGAWEECDVQECNVCERREVKIPEVAGNPYDKIDGNTFEKGPFHVLLEDSMEEPFDDGGAVDAILNEKIIQQPSAFDTQVGGSHYKQYEIQPYEFFYRNNIPHHKAAIIRRILRYDHPTGHGIEDLKKIRHELELLIELGGL